MVHVSSVLGRRLAVTSEHDAVDPLDPVSGPARTPSPSRRGVPAWLARWSPLRDTSRVPPLGPATRKFRRPQGLVRERRTTTTSTTSPADRSNRPTQHLHLGRRGRRPVDDEHPAQPDALGFIDPGAGRDRFHQELGPGDGAQLCVVLEDHTHGRAELARRERPAVHTGPPFAKRYPRS